MSEITNHRRLKPNDTLNQPVKNCKKKKTTKKAEYQQTRNEEEIDKCSFHI